MSPELTEPVTGNAFALRALITDDCCADGYHMCPDRPSSASSAFVEPASSRPEDDCAPPLPSAVSLPLLGAHGEVAGCDPLGEVAGCDPLPQADTLLDQYIHHTRGALQEGHEVTLTCSREMTMWVVCTA